VETAYFFETTFEYEGDFDATMSFSMDDGFAVYFDDNPPRQFTDGAQDQWCELQELPVGHLFDHTKSTHKIRVWGVNGHCTAPCTYANNPAGFSIRLEITPR
jgi:hypothetical protein